MEPLNRKTRGVCGGRACIGNRRLPVWSLVSYRRLGASDAQLLSQFDPPLNKGDLEAAWSYADRHAEEIAADLRNNDENE